MPSEDSLSERCVGCGYHHLSGSHTCGYATDEAECCACKAQQEPEPPMSSEEEEEAPEDWRCKVCKSSAGTWCDRSVCAEPCGGMHNRCNECGTPDGPCPNDVTAQPPPQPERRPPLAVTYSVQGHLYEVALSGDASVLAMDGALIIRHHLGPVAGIVQVLPVLNERSADGAEADQ